jgi:ATP-dependent Clp protease ATP-binding subunit ClpX
VPPQGGRKHPEQKMIQIDTKNILFICGGAFDGIDKHIERRMNTASIGFRSAMSQEEVQSWLQFISPADLKQFGLIPELIGRFPVLTFLNPLNATALRRILTEPKNALVLDFIVEQAMEYQLGARGLRSICEAILLDAMFEIPNNKDQKEFKVTLTYAKEQFGKSKISKLKVA